MKRPLTVLQITSSGNLSGGTRQAGYLSQGLREGGHRVVFAGPEGSAVLRQMEESSIETLPLSFDGWVGRWKASRALRRLATEIGADVVHAHHTQGHNVALLATFGGGFPPVVANRGVLFRPEFPAKFRSRKTAAVVTNSQAVRRVLVEAGIPETKVHVVYNACVPPAPEAASQAVASIRRELSLEGEGPIVGAVGRARPEKGFQFLVEAAPAILRDHPSARFVLIGNGTERFLPQLAALGVADRFRVPGHRSDAARAMGLFDLFVLPSVGMDSCPNVVLEAMAAGVPVVGADVGGVSEIVVEGETGRVVRPGDTGALAAAVRSLLSDPAAAKQMGQRGAERVRDRFSLEGKVARTLDVYSAVLTKRGLTSDPPNDRGPCR